MAGRQITLQRRGKVFPFVFQTASRHAEQFALVAAGADAIFVEVHDDPPKALSDAATQLSPEEFRTLVVQLLAVRAACDRLEA